MASQISVRDEIEKVQQEIDKRIKSAAREDPEIFIRLKLLKYTIQIALLAGLPDLNWQSPAPSGRGAGDPIYDWPQLHHNLKIIGNLSLSTPDRISGSNNQAAFINTSNAVFTSSRSLIPLAVGRAIEPILKEALDLSDSIRKLSEEAKGVVASAESRASILAVRVHVKEFGNAAKANQVLSKWWLWSSIIAFVVVVGFSFHLFRETLKSMGANASISTKPTQVAEGLGVAATAPAEIVSNVSFSGPPITMHEYYATWAIKIFIVSMLFYAMTFCVRKHRLHLHLYIINLHRELALKTYETFVGEEASAEARSAMRSEVMRTIFSPPNTGLVGAEESATPPLAEILVRSLDRGGAGSTKS